jgi:hypothetical protein
MHLEADRARARLPLTSACRVLSQAGEILPANAFGGRMFLDFAGATVVHNYLEMHLGFAAEFVDVSKELALVGTNRFAKALVIVEDRSETEWQDSGLLKTVCDYPCVIYSGFLVKGLRRVVFAHHDRQLAGGVKEDLVAAYSQDGFHRNRLAMTG